MLKIRQISIWTAGCAVLWLSAQVASATSVSGTVVDSASGEPLPRAFIQLFAPDGREFAFGTTDDDGTFLIENVPPITYFAWAYKGGYRPELFREIPCPELSCNQLQGEPIEVSIEQGATGVDFSLDYLGIIRGSLRAAGTGEPLPGIAVDAYNAEGQFRNRTGSRDDGSFEMTGLEPGEYFLVTAFGDSYQNEMFEDVPCQRGIRRDCQPGDGTSIQVVLDQPTEGIDFQLEMLGGLSGRVVDADSGEPIVGILLNVYDEQGSFWQQATSRTDGSYEVMGLPRGSYRVVTRPSFSQSDLIYVDELFDDIRCFGGPDEGCELADGTLIPVELEAVTSGIDFELVLGGSISGTVLNQDTGQPDPSSSPRVFVYDADGHYLTADNAEPDGSYQVRGLAAGIYYAIAGARDYEPELFAEIPCPGGQVASGLLEACGAGTPITVADSTDTPGIHFTIQQLGGVTGTVTTTATGEPLTGRMVVQAYDASGSLVENDFPNSDGVFEIRGLEAGPHYIVAQTRDQDSPYVGELHEDIPCESLICNNSSCGLSCDLGSGTAIDISLGPELSVVDFALDEGGRLTGTVRDEEGEPIHQARMQVLLPSGERLERTWFSDEAGAFTIEGLAAGTYFLLAEKHLYETQLLGGIPCSDDDCDLTMATPVTVELGQAQGGFDFSLSLASPVCRPEFGKICLNGGRFEVAVFYAAPSNGLTPARGVRLTEDSGYFTFFSDQNVELLVKVLDACAPQFDRFWVFAAGLTNLHVVMRITDVLTGEQRTWTNPLGSNFIPILDTDAFDTCAAMATDPPSPPSGDPQSSDPPPEQPAAQDQAAGTCVPSPQVQCLMNGRFEVTASWRTADGQEGLGQSRKLTEDTGAFWFFNEDNLELILKVIDACVQPFDRFWVFSAGLTNVDVTLTVRDTVSGEVRQYRNQLGTPFEPNFDTDAFTTCGVMP